MYLHKNCCLSPKELHFQIVWQSVRLICLHRRIVKKRSISHINNKSIHDLHKSLCSCNYVSKCFTLITSCEYINNATTNGKFS